jgi:hypothetical protein
VHIPRHNVEGRYELFDGGVFIDAVKPGRPVTGSIRFYDILKYGFWEEDGEMKVGMA